jgi:hypothetical protein
MPKFFLILEIGPMFGNSCNIYPSQWQKDMIYAIEHWMFFIVACTGAESGSSLAWKKGYADGHVFVL